LINLYDKNEINFNHNGLVVLNNCKSCFITEDLNGQYELELEYPLLEPNDRIGTITPTRIVGRNLVGETGTSMSSEKYIYLLEDNIIKANGQLFRIYRKQKTLDGIKVNARHIFYDLLDNFLEDVRPTNLNGAGALDWTLTHTQYTHPFSSMSDVSTVATKYFIRKNPVEAILGKEGIISAWGGELVRDNFAIKLLQARGLDRGVLIAYGKNIQGIEETLNIDGICTRLMPIGKDGLLLPEKYIDSPYINNFPHPKIKTIEFSNIETVEELRAAGQKYMLDNKIDIPTSNYKVDFLELTKTEEYKNYAILETVNMGDTVTVKHSKLNIDLKCKVIKIVKNVLTNRIEKVELGSFKENIATSINNSIQTVKTEIENTKSSLQGAIDNATTQINSALGGYVVKRNGELLIMDTKDINTATKVWRWNVNGLGYSSTGYNGPYRLAITADGHFVADFIDTGKLTADIIKLGVLASLDGSISINMANGTFTIGGGTNTAEHTNSHSKWSHSDGSYTQIGADGLKRHVGNNDKNYHYLCETGMVTINVNLDGNGIYSGSATITLPDDFKGKNFKAICSINTTYAPSAQIMSYIGTEISSINYANATFVINGYYGNKKFTDYSYVQGCSITVAYIVIV
jgi:phage minor structural protein